MRSAQQRCHRIQEFVAHSLEVTCLAFSSQFHEIVATGGDDCKVNIWRVTNASNIWSLSGHTNPIGCLCFDSHDKYIISGSTAGGIRVHDLEQGKTARTLQGHSAGVTAVCHHPYGEFLLSGSKDTNFKLWDVRSKNCLVTYKGHTEEITCARFSPDGQWCATAGKDGVLTIWELRKREVLHKFQVPKSSIITFEFHPTELTLAAATSERVVRFWDSDKLELVSVTPPEPHPVRTMCFSTNGTSPACLVAASQDNVRVLNGSNGRLIGQYDVGWDRVAAVTITQQNKLVAGGFVQNFATFWVAELSDVLGEPPLPPPTQNGSEAKLAGDVRPGSQDNSSNKEGQRAGPILSNEANVSCFAVAEAKGADNRRVGGHAKPQSPPIPNQSMAPPPQQAQEEKQLPITNKYDARRPKSSSSCDGGSASSNIHVAPLRRASSELDGAPPYTGNGESQHQPQHSSIATNDRRPRTGSEPPGGSSRGHSRASSSSSSLSQPPQASDEAIILETMRHRATLTSTLSARLSHLRLLADLWSKGDLSGTFKLLRQLHDGQKDDGTRFTIVADFLRVVDLHHDGVTLEASIQLLPVLNSLLSLDFENHVVVGLRGIETIFDMYGEYVRQVLSSVGVAVGVDLSREERQERCMQFHELIMQTYTQLDGVAHVFRVDSPVQDGVTRLRRHISDYLGPGGRVGRARGVGPALLRPTRDR